MPDTINNGGYNRANDFLDTGYANLNPSAPPTQFPATQEGGQESHAPSAQDIFDSIGQNLKQTAIQQNPFLSSIKFNTPVKTPLDETVRYNSSKYGFNPFNPELEHQYAARQGWFDAWKNNILKFGAQAGGTFLETVTAIPHVMDGLKNGDFSKIYNNPLSNSIREWTDGFEQTLPNYQSAFEDQHPVLSYIPGFASLKTLGDKWGGVLKTLGFVVGSVGGAALQDALVGAATGGVGELPLIEPQLMAMTGKIGKIFASEGGAVKLAQSIKNGMAVEDAVNGLYNTVKNTDRFRYGLSLFTSATGGSIIFANGVYNDVKKNLTNEFYSKYGRDPQEADAAKISEYARTAGNIDLFANTALQMKVFDSVFGTLFKPTSAVMKEAESKVPVALQKDSLDVFEAVNPQGKFSILRKVANAGTVKTQLTTAAEMAGIYGIGRTAEGYAQRKFDDASVSDTDNFTRALATGLYDTFTTEQGIENIMIGVLGGALIHGGKTLLESKRGIENNSDVVSKNVLALLNSSGVSDMFKNTYNEAVTSDSLAKSMKKAADSGDVFEYQNLKFQQLYNFISSGAKAGKHELRLAQLENLKDLKGEEFQKMFGLDYSDANRRTVNEYVDGVIKKSKDIKENIDKVDTVFKNPFKESDRKNYVAFEEYKNQLALDLSEMSNNRERLKSITQEISKTAPLLDKNKLIDLTHEIGIPQTIKRFEDRIKSIDEVSKLADKTSDSYKQDQKEKDFLQEKVKELQTGDGVDYHPDLYNTIGEIVNYYANGDTQTGENNIHPIDLLPLLNNAQDAFKLENANNRALYHYQQLTGKKGFDNYIQDVLAANNKNYARFMDNLVENLKNPTGPEVPPAGEDTITIDEGGNPVKQAPKTETKYTKEKPEKTEVQKAAEKRESEAARKDYEAKRAEIEKKKAAEIKQTEESTGKPLTEEIKNDIEERYDTLQTELDKTQPVIMSTDKADEEVDISEIENPEAEATMKAAQDTKSEKHGALKNSIFKNFDPFVYVYRLFSRNFEDSKENDNLRNAIFTNTPQKLYSKLQVNVSKSTKGKKSTEYSKIDRLANVYRRGYSHDIDLVADGSVIGKIQPADSLVYKKGDEYLPLTAIPKDDYENITGNELSTYEEFINGVRAYQEVTDTIMKHFNETGKKTFTNVEVQQLFNTFVRYGKVNYSKGSATSTPLSDLKYKTNGDFVISLPAEYDKSGKIVRSGEPAILNENELNSVDNPKAWQFIADNIKQLKAIDSRYIYVTKMPDGTYSKLSPLAARPRQSDAGTIGGLLDRIRQITGTTDKAAIRKLNHDLRNDIFISDTNNRKGKGTNLHLYMHEDGKAYINVINTKLGFRQGYFLPDIKAAKNLDEVVNQINTVLQRKGQNDSILQGLNLKLDVQDFKTSIPDADRIPLSELRNQLDVVAPHENIFDEFSLHVLPLKSKPSEGFKPAEPVKEVDVQDQALLDALKESVAVNEAKEPVKENIETLANAGVEDQKKLVETIVAAAEADPEGTKEVLGEKVVEKAQAVAKVKPPKKKIAVKKTPTAEAKINSIADRLGYEYVASEEDFSNPSVFVKDDKVYIYKGHEFPDGPDGEAVPKLYDTLELRKSDQEDLKQNPEEWLRKNVFDEYFIKDKSIEQTKKVATEVAQKEHIAPEVQVQGKEAPAVQSKQQIVEQAKGYVKDLPEIYQQHFLDNTEDTLKEVANQLVDPISAKLTRETFGDRISDAALKAFPEVKPPEHDLLAQVKEEAGKPKSGNMFGTLTTGKEKTLRDVIERYEGGERWPQAEGRAIMALNEYTDLETTHPDIFKSLNKIVEDFHPQEATLEEAVKEQVSSLPDIPVPDLHAKAKNIEEINNKYSEQLNNLNNEIDKVYVKREGLLDFQKKRELTEDEKKQLDNYNHKIERLTEDIHEYEAERQKEIDAVTPKEIETGDKVLYEGKEVIVSDKSDSGNGEPVYTVTDGGEGESVVYKDSLYKIDPTMGQAVDLPSAIEKDFEAGDRVWFNNKQYKVLFTNKDKVSIEDPKTEEILNVIRETLVSDNDVVDDASYAVDYTGLKAVLDTLRKRFNIQYQVVNDSEGKWQGRFKDGVVYINKNTVDRTTPFHEYLHPFMKVLEVDNPELYKNLVDEFDNLTNEGVDDLAVEANAEVNKDYKDSSDADKKQEALVRYISKLAAQNVTAKGQKVGSQYMRAMKSLIERFRSWLGKLMGGLFGVNLSKIPTEATLQDMSDFISLTDYGYDLQTRSEVVGNMDVFQKASDDFNTEILDRLKRNLDKFGKTAKRLNSEELGTEAAAIRRIFDNKEEAESLNSFVFQGMKGLSWAIDEFSRITGKVKNPENNLDAKDIQELNKSLDVVKQMVAFYREDVNDLFKRVGDRRSMDDEEYRTYAETLRQANVVADKIQTRSVDLMVEWLYPAIQHTNELIREKYPDFVLDKEAFRKELYNATGDVDRLFFALGSVGSSKDPVSAIVSNVIKDVVEDAHRYDAVLSHIIKTGYDNFLKEHSLPNDRNKTSEHYKENYLRKARILEKVGEDEAGEPKYEYVERWAFHQPYLLDKWQEEYEKFVQDQGPEPEDPIAKQAMINKRFDWQTENGTINEPSKRFLNPKFLDLYEKDKMFTILYDTYKEGNDNLHADQQLQFGIVPQVSKGKNMFSDLEWSKTGAVNAAKQLGRFLYPKAEPGNEFDVNMTNMDGSVYKKIRVAYVRPLDEADLDLALPETVFKFAGVANMSKHMTELEPNIRTLKSLLDGDSQFIKKARGVVDVIKKSKGNKAELLTNSVLSSKKAARLSLVNKQLSAFIDDVVYGDTEVKDTFGKLDLNKWGNNMAFLTALNNMAFNITAGISNVVIGDIQGFGEAIGGKYYKTENYRKAQGQYWSSIKDFANDVTALKKSKITQLGVKYDAVQGEFRDKFGKRFVGNVMQKYATADTLFIFNHAGEHHIQLTGMLALMDATKVKMADGSTVSLFDAHEITPNGYLKLKDGADWTDEQNNDFTKRLHSLNKMLNGNYSKFDKAYLQRKWYGKLALIYRKYLYNSFRARYGKKRVDYELQDVYEGYYRTFFHKLGKDIKAYKFEAAKRMLTRDGWTDDEKYAYNKTMYELGLFTGISMMGIAIGANQSKDDDKSWGKDYLTLLMLRARQDVGQYTMFGIPDMMRIMKNPSAVIQSLSRYSDFFLQLTTQPFATYKRKTGPFSSGTSVLQAKMLKAIPIMRQVINVMSPAEQQKFFNLVNKNF